MPDRVALREIENIANPTDRPNASGPVSITLNFRAKPADVHFQVVPGVRSIRAPCVVQQRAPGDDPTDIVHQLP